MTRRGASAADHRACGGNSINRGSHHIPAGANYHRCTYDHRPDGTVPSLVGIRAGRAKTALSRRGLRWTVSYKSTNRSAPGTVISQSGKAGAEVRPGTRVALVIAKAPPPPPTTAAARNYDGVGCESG